MQNEGSISDSEMLRTFNCGIGMAIIVSAELATDTIDILTTAGETAMIIGDIVAGDAPPAVEFVE